jgi:hypothetical protein
MDESVLPAPLASHFQIAPSLQNLVFGTQAVSVHTPSEQACEGKQVSAMVSLAPSAPQTLTFKPSQRRVPAPHDPPGGSELFPSVFPSVFVEFDFFDEPLHASARNVNPSTATPRPMNLPITYSRPKTPIA